MVNFENMINSLRNSLVFVLPQYPKGVFSPYLGPSSDKLSDCQFGYLYNLRVMLCNINFKLSHKEILYTFLYFVSCQLVNLSAFLRHRPHF